MNYSMGDMQPELKNLNAESMNLNNSMRSDFNMSYDNGAEQMALPKPENLNDANIYKTVPNRIIKNTMNSADKAMQKSSYKLRAKNRLDISKNIVPWVSINLERESNQDQTSLAKSQNQSFKISVNEEQQKDQDMESENESNYSMQSINKKKVHQVIPASDEKEMEEDEEGIFSLSLNLTLSSRPCYSFINPNPPNPTDANQSKAEQASAEHHNA